MSELCTHKDMARNAAEHLRLVGPRQQLVEAIDGMIESAIDGVFVKLGYGCSIDPRISHDYAEECFRQALDELL